MPTYKRLTAEERTKLWTNELNVARDGMRPWFEACKILQDQYNNVASNMRELDLEQIGDSAEQHTERIKANIVYGWIDQSIANMLDGDPTFSVTAQNKSAVPYVDISRRIINHYYETTKQSRVDRRCVLDAFLNPYAVAKIGYTVDFDARTQDIIQEATQELDEPEDENLFLLVGQPSRVAEHHDHIGHIEAHTEALQQPDVHPQAAQVLTEHIKIHELMRDRAQPDAHIGVNYEAPSALRWRPEHFLVDSRAQDGVEDAGWIAFEWEAPISEVLANPNYKNLTDLKPSGRVDGAPERSETDEWDNFDLVRGAEIWVRNHPISKNKFANLLIVIAEGHALPLREEDEWPYDLREFPVQVLTFQQGVDSWFNKPPLLLAGADTVQSLMNEILDSFLYIARKQKNIWLYDPQFIDEDTLQNILDAPDGTVFSVKGLADPEHTGRIVMPLPFHSVPSERLQLMQITQSALDRAAGTPQPVPLPGTETATESSIMDRKNTSRENYRASELAIFQQEKASKMWRLVLQFQPPDIGLIEEGAEEAILVSPVMAEGRYRLGIDISSQSSNLAVERSQGMQLLNLFAGLAPAVQQMHGITLNIPEMMRRLLRRGYREADPDVIIPQPPAPQAQGAGVPLGPPGQEITDPNARVAQDAIVAGRRDSEIGPANPDTFNRDIPREGQQNSEAQTL